MKIYSLCLLLLIFLYSCIPTYFSDVFVSSDQMQKQTDTLHIDHLLVLSYGNMSSRVVTDNFHLAIKDQIQKRGSRASFAFASIFDKNKTTDTIELKESYNGYLFLTPSDTASIIYNQQKFIFATPLGSGYYGSGSGYGNAFDDVFSIKLYNAKRELVYRGKIHFSMDPTRDDLYTKAAKEWMEQLKKSSILLW